jgi:polar amino acid transport system substrate-binding protein
MVEVMKEIFGAKGVEIDYQLMPWDACLKTVEKGRFDAVIGTDDEEAPNLLFPDESFGKYQSAFYVKKGTPWSYKGIDSLKQIRLGVIDGYVYGGDLDKYLESDPGSDKVFTIKDEDALPNLLKMLKAGRIDAVVENMPVVEYALRAENFQRGEIVYAGSDDINFYDLFVAFSPSKATSKKYAKIFDDGIKELRSSGKLKEILAKYGLEDWK